jgi:hypothetical protein
MSETRLILHVKGTEAETAELPKTVVRAAISQGDLTQSQLIWCKTDHAWKQAREFPDLLPVQNAVPVALNAATPVPKPVPVMARPVVQPQVKVMAVQPQMQTAPKAMKAHAPPMAVAKPYAQVTVPVQSGSSKSYTVKEEADHNHPMKWVCIVLGALILITLAGNYFLVEQPLASNLRQTSYGSAPVYAHFGAFFQPNVIVIHVPVSQAITADNLADFLVNLAASTPDSPMGHDAFGRVALTSGWTAQYSLSGYSWKQLGGMKDDDKAAREEFLLAQLGDAGGEPLLHASTQSEEAQKAARDRIWQTFIAHFTSKQ